MDTYNPNHCQKSEPIQNILHKTVIGYHIYVKIQKLLLTMKKADEQVKKKLDLELRPFSWEQSRRSLFFGQHPCGRESAGLAGAD